MNIYVFIYNQLMIMTWLWSIILSSFFKDMDDMEVKRKVGMKNSNGFAVAIGKGSDAHNRKCPCRTNDTYPLVICYIAIENGHRNRGFTHWIAGDFP